MFFKSQYGFRKQCCTQHAILDILNKIQSNLDKKLYSCGIFIDLEKAFDTVDHNLLLCKLHHNGGSSQNAGSGSGSGSGVFFFPNFFVSIFVVILLYCYFLMFGIFSSSVVEISQATYGIYERDSFCEEYTLNPRDTKDSLSSTS